MSFQRKTRRLHQCWKQLGHGWGEGEKWGLQRFRELSRRNFGIEVIEKITLILKSRSKWLGKSEENKQVIISWYKIYSYFTMFLRRFAAPFSGAFCQRSKLDYVRIWMGFIEFELHRDRFTQKCEDSYLLHLDDMHHWGPVLASICQTAHVRSLVNFLSNFHRLVKRSRSLRNMAKT